MGYPEKLQKFCVLRSIDQSELARRLGISKSSMSRILSGAQEPKLKLAGDLARILGVSLDYLVDDTPEEGPAVHPVAVSDDELTILKLVRRLGCEVALDRLLGVNAAGGGTGGVDAESPPSRNEHRHHGPGGDRSSGPRPS